MKPAQICLLLALLFQQSAIAQLSTKYSIRYFTTENGLPSNGLKRIQWDKENGFLWCASQAGIVRFNGIDFKTFSNQNTPFIKSERIWDIIANRKGGIYVMDDYRNLISIQKNKISLFAASKNTNTAVPFYALFVSETFYTEKLNHPATAPYADAYMKDIMPISDTSLVYINSQKVYFNSLNNDKPILVETGGQVIKAVFELSGKFFFLTGENKILQKDFVTGIVTPIAFNIPFTTRDNKVNIIWESGMDNPIILNGTDAWLLESKDSSIQAIKICDVIPRNFRFMGAQYSRENKLLFLSTDSKGLVVVSENRVEVMKRIFSGSDSVTSYYSQIELPQNAILTSEGHLIGREKNIENPFPIKTNFYFNNYITGDSVLWYLQPVDSSGRYYLNSYNYKTRLQKAYKKIPIMGRFGLACSNEKIYVVTNVGFAVLENDSLRYLFKSPDEKAVIFDVFGMLEISPGRFAVTSCPGLVVYDINKSSVDTLLKLPGYCVRTVWKYKDYVFIGTYGKGYYIYKDGKIKSMPLDKNRFLTHAHCFIADKDGFCWISTNRGLFKASLDDIIKAFEKNEEKIYYHYYGRSDGMDNTEMNGGCTPCGLQMRSGIISFPTMDGLLWVDPERSQPILPTGDVFIDELYADNKRIDLKSSADLEMPANVNALTVYLGYPAWCNKENLYIEYDLNNSGAWKPVDLMNNSVIHLFGLSSGKYDLRIRKMKGFGDKNYSYDELKFEVETPWYLQWWAFIVLAIVAYAIGRFFVQLRIKQYRLRQEKLEKLIDEKTSELKLKNEILEKNDTIKTRLISIISHDIITPLRFLSVAGKNLVEKRALMSEELQNETISEMTTTSQDLQLLSTNILNWIKYQNENRRLAKENFNVCELVNQVIGVLKSMAHQKGLQISNRVDDSLEIFQFAEPLRILIYNLVSNAINFSETGNIVINNEQQPGMLIISVEDEGIGMSPEQISNIMAEQIVITARKTDSRQGNGLGYLIIKDLVKMLGGELKITSGIGQGTTVEVFIPVTAAENKA